ncbi:phage tail sheath protein FI [Kibdelosporangium banguiense]|uniref:Phage tail sheath protein FI n=1 Tax=Kibdelosporangium banguiense TaxID=1365924 RepID=A0ABS4U185_9PSEU|nr:phage tail sheath subtilisin-like domain-containing protein [Kibdelosporangium banguiense]MBP2330404.1 phage tail sheath protein FI [Kibdelosporangium banguiense]
MTIGEALPGVTLTFVPRGSQEEPLRTDVAAFLGRTRRGPLGVPVRGESWNDVVGTFGQPDGSSATPYALRGFFENGGRTAWVIRVSGPAETASAQWLQYQVIASSPGAWANGGRVAIRFQASTLAGPPTVSVRVTVPGEPAETFAGIPPSEVVTRLATSRLIRLVPVEQAPPPAPARRDERPRPGGPPISTLAEGSDSSGAISRSWDLILAGGSDVAPGQAEYSAAVQAQADLPEPALVALPDLGADLTGETRGELARELMLTALTSLDRLVVLDVPPDKSSVDEAVKWTESLGDKKLLSTAAAYHPALEVPGTPGARTVPASGHVLGVIARLDAERGAHHTPANAVILEAVDLAVEFPEPQQVRLFEAGINLVRCTRGRGLLVWGGRTLSNGFIAHRRLVHLLVRAIRRVAGPLVFDVNSPELRLTLVRALTSVLLAAFRAGALAGSRAEQAFRVTCDESNNPPEQDPGQVVCEIEVAPAAPMEFIRLRLVLGQDRDLEVIEA